MEITEELVTYLEKLGRIRLSEEEKKKTQVDLGAILGYMDKLNELDTKGVEPMSHAFPATNVFRNDEVTTGNMRDDILLNAPDYKDGAFKVPQAVD